MDGRLENIVKHWDFSKIEILEQFHKDSPRLLYKIKADEQLYLLKGIPQEKSESIIRGNVTAHQFLGNEKGMAPRIIAMKNGDYFVKENGFWFYLLEFIEGGMMEATVEHDEEMNVWYRFDLAQAYLRGYYGEAEITRQEYDMMWQGAAFMQISYMKCYGEDAVDSLWKILEFGLAQKEALWDNLRERQTEDI